MYNLPIALSHLTSCAKYSVSTCKLMSLHDFEHEVPIPQKVIQFYPSKWETVVPLPTGISEPKLKIQYSNNNNKIITTITFPTNLALYDLQCPLICNFTF